MNLPFYSCLLAWWGYTLFHDENDKGFSIGIWRLSLIHNLISWKPWWKKATAVVWLSLMNDYSWGQLWAMIYWLIYSLITWEILSYFCQPEISESFAIRSLQMFLCVYLCLLSLISDCILCYPFLDRCCNCWCDDCIFVYHLWYLIAFYAIRS